MSPARRQCVFFVIFALFCPIFAAKAQDQTEINRDESSVASTQADQQPGSLRASSSPGLRSAAASTVSVQELSIPASARKALEKGRRLLVDEHRADQSLAILHKAVQIAPGFWEAHFLLGIAYMDLRKWTEAEPSLRKAIAANAHLGAAYLALGSCLVEDGQYPEAETQLLKGLELSPAAAHGHYDLSRTYYTLGRLDEARLHAQRAVELGPPQADVHFLLGNILVRLDEKYRALAEFQECLRLAPGMPIEALAQEQIRRLQAQQVSAR